MSIDVLDDLDKEILRIMVEDCSLSVRKIARMLGKSPTIISKKIQRLKDLGVLEKCTAVINYRKLGYNLMALILFNVVGAHIEEVEKILASELNVRGVYDITGQYDVAVLALFKDVEELDKFIKKILKHPHIKGSVTSVIFKAVKDGIHIGIP
ncbi:MAG: Lrp/AsnC family transcriptional regulator [Desulfurococcaceae archaeon]|jgi:DNA-binding Lrp family transcriptional regulator|nr:Lrp/AsnC family transcriptional regulator [Desulfurococcaceae archaeon]